MNTTAGSYALLGARVPRDAGVATKLREAGALTLGKANMAEFSGFRTLNDTGSWSAYGGQNYGAYYPKMDPGGYSGGSAVAASLGLAFGTLGTGANAGIISPADSNNVVAIHPTIGLTSNDFIVEFSGNYGTPRPMARTVKDAAYMLQAMAGVDSNDNHAKAVTRASDESYGPSPDYVAACNLDALQGKRIGVPRNSLYNYSDYGSAIPNAFEAALGILRDAGAIVVDNTNYTAVDEWYNYTDALALSDIRFKEGFELYTSQLSANPNNIYSVEDLLNFSQTSPLENYPTYGTEGFEEVLGYSFSSTSPEFKAIYEKSLELVGKGGLLGALETYKLDTVVIPSAWVVGGVSGALGAPVISVPLGAFPPDTEATQVLDNFDTVSPSPNYPFSIAFCGPRFSEELLIGMAYAFEQRTKVRQKIKPYLELSIELADAIGSKS